MGILTLGRIFRRLSENRRGTSTIELAILAPVGAAMLTGMIDISLGYSARLNVIQAAQRGIEVVTARGKKKEDSYAYVATEVRSNTTIPVDEVVVDNWLECGSDGTMVRQAASVLVCTATQDSARYVSVTVRSHFTPFVSSNPIWRGEERDRHGNIKLSAKSLVRTE